MPLTKEITGFQGYWISENGDIFSSRSRWGIVSEKRKIKPVKMTIGYLKVALRKDGETYQRYLHRILAEEFIENPFNKPCINHKNGIKSDNSINNLEWCSYSENELHAYKIGLKKPKGCGGDAIRLF